MAESEVVYGCDVPGHLNDYTHRHPYPPDDPAHQALVRAMKAGIETARLRQAERLSETEQSDEKRAVRG